MLADENKLLPLEEAASCCGFDVSTFLRWTKTPGLLPSAHSETKKWSQAGILDAIADLERHGHEPNVLLQKKRTSEYLPLPSVHRIRRSLTDGTAKFHHRHRKTGDKLPGSYGSPEMMRTLIKAERAIAARSKIQNNGKLLSVPVLAENPISPASPSTEEQFKHLEKVLMSFDDIPLHSQGGHLTAYLTPEEVAVRWRRKLALETLANWRAKRIGPPFIKIGKTILYPLALLLKWEQQNLVLCGIRSVVRR